MKWVNYIKETHTYAACTPTMNLHVKQHRAVSVFHSRLFDTFVVCVAVNQTPRGLFVYMLLCDCYFARVRACAHHPSWLLMVGGQFVVSLMGFSAPLWSERGSEIFWAFYGLIKAACSPWVLCVWAALLLLPEPRWLTRTWVCTCVCVCELIEPQPAESRLFPVCRPWKHDQDYRGALEACGGGHIVVGDEIDWQIFLSGRRTSFKLLL